MRYLVGLMFVLAGLVALPQSVSAQAGEEGTTSEPNLQEPAPSSEPATEQPALQLKLDDAGVEVVPTADGFYILEPTELRGGRARGAKIGLGVSAGFLVVGAVMTAVGFTSFDFESSLAPLWTGVAFMVGGSVGLIASGVMLRGSNRKPRRQKEAHYGTPRRAQWDLAQSRLVF